MASIHKKITYMGEVVLQFGYIIPNQIQVLKTIFKGLFLQSIYTVEASPPANCQETATTSHKMQRQEATWKF